MIGPNESAREDRDIMQKAAEEPTPLILIGEDSTEVRIIMTRTLENEHCSCMIAANGHEIITMALKYNPEVILLDLLLPGINGFQVLLHLRNRGYDGKVCIVSVMDDGETVQKALDFGALDYLVKPIFPETLVHKVNLLLKRIDRLPELPWVTCQLSGYLNQELNAHQCSIIRLCGVQVIVRCFEQFEVGDILRLDSAALKRIIDRTEAVAVRVVDQEHDQITLELIGLSDKSRRLLGTAMLRGDFLTDCEILQPE